MNRTKVRICQKKETMFTKELNLGAIQNFDLKDASGVEIDTSSPVH